MSCPTPLMPSPTGITLLTIPREIRNQILDIVVTTPQTPPRDISDLGNRVTRDDFTTIAWSTQVSEIRYSSNDNRVDAMPILLSNKQLRDEALSAIKRAPRDYVLDILMADERHFYPTWLVAPCLTDSAGTVRANIRIKEVENMRFRTRMLRYGDGSPPYITWVFYRIFERFLQRGPVIDPRDGEKQQDREISISVLELNFQSAGDSVDTPESHGTPHEDTPHENKKTGIKKTVTPDGLLNLLEGFIYSLMGMGYHMARYGDILYERVGKIRFLLDGKLRSEESLGERLKKLQFNDSFGDHRREYREDVWRDWKRKAHAERIQRGLDVEPLA